MLAATLVGSVFLVSNAYADDFCDGLKVVIADTPRNFINTHGPAGKQPGYFTHTYLIPEAVALFPEGPPCVATQVPGDEKHLSYGCTFRGPVLLPDAKPAYASFIHRVQACLDLPEQKLDLSAPSDTRPLASSARGPVTLYTPGATVAVGLTYPPDGGPGALTVQIRAAP